MIRNEILVSNTKNKSISLARTSIISREAAGGRVGEPGVTSENANEPLKESIDPSEMGRVGRLPRAVPKSNLHHFLCTL
jgi:hypothetical protein